MFTPVLTGILRSNARPKFRVLILFLATLIWVWWGASLLPGQRELAGAARNRLELERLRVTGSALMIAAHPDDENTALLAWLSRGKKVRTGYLSLTRGEGGQNLIGTEQGDALGLIRTQELLAARGIDGAEQFFSRAIDFGYSKTLEETFDRWGHERTLGDVVWTIRRFRPDVIVLRFSGTSRDGHGHHQASAILGREAFEAAADPKRFPEQLQWVQPWRARRLLWNVFSFNAAQEREAAALPAKIEVDLGEYDPVLGYSYGEIAGMSRSKHRTQAMGAPERRGSMKNFLQVIAGEPANRDVFEGIDLSWNRVAGGKAIGALLDQAAASYRDDHPENSVPMLLKALRAMQGVRDPIAERKRRDVAESVALCAGVSVDAVAGQYEIRPGEQLKVTATALNRGDLPVTVQEAVYEIDGATALKTGSQAEALPRNQTRTLSETSLAVPANHPYSQPYWLVEPPDGASYRVARQELVGLPENPPVFSYRFVLSTGSQSFELTRPVRYRYIEPDRGELVRPVYVVPRISVQAPERVLIFPNSEKRALEIALQGSGTGDMGLVTPPGWKVQPISANFSLSATAPQTVLRFQVSPLGRESQAAAIAEAKTPEGVFNLEKQEILYPHIPPQILLRRAEIKLVRADIRSLAKTVGYIMGAGDRVPDALRQVGAEVVNLSADDLAYSDLSRFDAIVTGVRAYNVRRDLRANQARLLEYVRNGGTLLVQYNTGAMELGPYPLKTSYARVSVENAPVTIEDPKDALLLAPNQITQRDFEGWVQERGLYFASQWDPRYHPLWETHDPGEAPQRGGTLYTRYGKGVFIFSPMSWFRQLPAGVPGAFRIFANLLSAGKAHPGE